MTEKRTAVRAPGSTGKWHLIGHDDTLCDQWFISDNWDHVPRETIDPADLCRKCTYWERPYSERRRVPAYRRPE
jgi:hypothetical protein